MEFIYPAKFTVAGEGGYDVSFPDFYGAYTCGDNFQMAYEWAEDCLGGVLFDCEEGNKGYPKATPLSDFPKNTESEFVMLIAVDLVAYKKKTDEKPVRKTLYIPKGLNDRAEEKGLNFSKVLRDALSDVLGG